jgi:hypothetical protein
MINTLLNNRYRLDAEFGQGRSSTLTRALFHWSLHDSRAGCLHSRRPCHLTIANQSAPGTDTGDKRASLRVGYLAPLERCTAAGDMNS